MSSLSLHLDVLRNSIQREQSDLPVCCSLRLPKAITRFVGLAGRVARLHRRFLFFLYKQSRCSLFALHLESIVLHKMSKLLRTYAPSLVVGLV
jgi:hypothetical protein